MSDENYNDKIEAAIVGLLEFVRAFLKTLVEVAFRPGRFGRSLGEKGRPYLRPFSFLTLCSFSVTTVARHAAAYLLLSLIALQRGCSSVGTNEPVEFPPLADWLSLPSFDTVVYVALPVVIVTLMLGWLVNWALVERRPGGGSSVLHAFVFVAGFQFVLVPVLIASGLGVNESPWFQKAMDTNSEKYLYGILGVALVPGLFWPLHSLVRICEKLPVGYRVRKRFLGRAYMLSVGTVSFVLSLSGCLGVAYALAKFDTRGVEESHPTMTAAVARMQRGPEGFSTVVFLLNNGSNRDLWLRVSPVLLSGMIKGEIVGAKVENELMHLPKGNTAAVEVRFAQVGFSDPLVEPFVEFSEAGGNRFVEQIRTPLSGGTGVLASLSQVVRSLKP